MCGSGGGRRVSRNVDSPRTLSERLASLSPLRADPSSSLTTGVFVQRSRHSPATTPAGRRKLCTVAVSSGYPLYRGEKTRVCLSPWVNQLTDDRLHRTLRLLYPRIWKILSRTQFILVSIRECSRGPFADISRQMSPALQRFRA